MLTYGLYGDLVLHLLRVGQVILWIVLSVALVCFVTISHFLVYGVNVLVSVSVSVTVRRRVLSQREHITSVFTKVPNLSPWSKSAAAAEQEKKALNESLLSSLSPIQNQYARFFNRLFLDFLRVNASDICMMC